MVVCVGRGTITDHALATISDNKSSGTYGTNGSAHNYPSYPDSGSQLYIKTGAGGGSSHRITLANPSTGDEVTTFAVEVRGATVVEGVSYGYADNPSPDVGPGITVAGPAVLIAFWWGDSSLGEDNLQVDSNWTMLNSTSLLGNHVQGGMAGRVVSGAGTYNVTFLPHVTQGGQIYIVALH